MFRSQRVFCESYDGDFRSIVTVWMMMMFAEIMGYAVIARPSLCARVLEHWSGNKGRHASNCTTTSMLYHLTIEGLSTLVRRAYGHDAEEKQTTSVSAPGAVLGVVRVRRVRDETGVRRTARAPKLSDGPYDDEDYY